MKETITIHWYNTETYKFEEAQAFPCECGSYNVDYVINCARGYKMQCFDCNVSTAYYSNHRLAVQAWNERKAF